MFRKQKKQKNMRVYLLNLPIVFVACLQNPVQTVKPSGIESPLAEVLRKDPGAPLDRTKHKAHIQTIDPEAGPSAKRSNSLVENVIGKITNINAI